MQNPSLKNVVCENILENLPKDCIDDLNKVNDCKNIFNHEFRANAFFEINKL
jgi:hypothetical protein